MLRMPSDAEATTLRNELDHVGFTEVGLVGRFGTATAMALDPINETVFRRDTRSGEPIDILAELFLLGRPVTHDRAAVLSKTLVDCALELQLLRAEAEGLIPTCLLACHGDLRIASDLYAGEDAPPARERVLSTGVAARHLANFASGSPGARVLDVCGGGGIQGLLASRWASEVWITDISERAIEYARRNAALNSVDNCVFRVGPGFEPAAGECFDRILCNPPFVVTPSQDVVALGNDMELDGFSRTLVREAPAHLQDGGLYQMIFEWTEQRGEPWHERLGTWVRDLPCDAWLLKVYTQQPDEYARARTLEASRLSGQSRVDALERWMSYYDTKGVSALHGGLLLLRSTSKRRWQHFDNLERVPTKPYGDLVAATLRRFDLLADHAIDESLLQIPFALAEHVTLETQHEHISGGWQPAGARLRIVEDLGRVQSIAPPIADFLAGFDGKQPLGSHLDRLLTQVEVEPDQVRAEVLRIVLHLAIRGFVVPLVEPSLSDGETD